MPKYSFENTIGELLDTPETRALIDELCPELLEHPMLEVGRPFKVNQALPSSRVLQTRRESRTSEEGLRLSNNQTPKHKAQLNAVLCFIVRQGASSAANQ